MVPPRIGGVLGGRPQLASPGGAESRVAWIALARAQADSAVRSTATRAERAGARVEEVDVEGVLRLRVHWVVPKYTLASVSRNQPEGPLPLPLIETFSVR